MCSSDLINISEVNTKPPFPVSLAHNNRIGQPRGMEHSSDRACRFQLLDFFCNELLAFHHLLPNSLLDGPRVRTNDKVVLNHFPGNTGDVRWLPCKHIDIRPQESNKRAFLFRVKRGTDGKGTTNAVLLGGHFLGLWRSCLCFLTLAGGARWCVLDGSAALRRGALEMSGKLIHEHLWGRRTGPLSVRRGAEIARRADQDEAHEQFTQLRGSPER